MRACHFALIAALALAPITGIVIIPASPLVAQANLSKVQIAELAEKITVLIQTPAGSGSGVIIAKEGDGYRVLTAWHVVESIKAGEEADITTPDGKTHRIDNRSIQRLPAVDMAVVSFHSGGTYTVAKVGNDLAVKRGMNVYVAGFPLPGRAITKPVLQFTDGTVTASSEILLTDGYALTYTNNTLPGMSGGPVLNERGELVGIHGRAEGSYQSTGQGNVIQKEGFNLAVPIRTYTAWVNKAPLQTTTVAKTAEQFLISGKQKAEAKNFQGAIADYNQAIKIDPNLADAYTSRGIAKSDLKDYEGAIADYNQALKIDPNYARAYNNRGIAKYYLKDYEGAIADYNQALKIDPNYARAYNNRGIVKRNLKDYEGAIADYNQAIQIDPNDPLPYNNRGIVKKNLKDYEGAIADYNQAIKIDPNYAVAYYNRGIAKSDLKDYQGAIADYNQAIKIDPNYARAYNNRGIAKYDLKDYQGAIADYNQAIKIDPNYAVAYNNRGLAKYDLKDYQGAIADYNQALKIDPNYALAYYNRGLVRLDVNDRSGGCADFSQALKMGAQQALEFYQQYCR